MGREGRGGVDEKPESRDQASSRLGMMSRVASDHCVDSETWRSTISCRVYELGEGSQIPFRLVSNLEQRLKSQSDTVPGSRQLGTSGTAYQGEGGLKRRRWSLLQLCCSVRLDGPGPTAWTSWTPLQGDDSLGSGATLALGKLRRFRFVNSGWVSRGGLQGNRVKLSRPCWLARDSGEGEKGEPLFRCVLSRLDTTSGTSRGWFSYPIVGIETWLLWSASYEHSSLWSSSEHATIELPFSNEEKKQRSGSGIALWETRGV
ncbi:hypothetical protein LIA77_09367 [Sarocladium implicatum]|nr:hypothetical protein LIA77_09367 [Sarocladium implicatum]